MITKFAISTILLAVVQAGKCPFGYGKQDDGPDDASLLQQDGNQIDYSQFTYPAEILTCPQSKTKTMSTLAEHFDKGDYESLFSHIVAHHDAMAVDKQAPFAACMVRLAGHDFMDFRLGQKKGKVYDTTGGSDGCVNFNDDDNKGLAECLHKSGIAQIYANWCHKLSMADFIVVAAEVLVGRLETHYTPTDPFKAGTMAQRFRDQFNVGRTTNEVCADNIGLMPNPENGCQGLKEVFADHIFKLKFRRWHVWKAIAAISGAHTLGMAHVNVSGYDGHWSTPADQGKFNNGYYKSMLKRGWGPERNVSGNPNKNQWQRIDQLPCNTPFKEMMLNTDLCLAYQFNTQHAECMKQNNRKTGKCNKFQRKGEFLNAHNNSCCAWTNSHILFHSRFGPVLDVNNNDFCGIPAPKHGNMRSVCCQHEPADSIGDCDAFNWPKGIQFDTVLKFAGFEEEFYKAYLQAWKVATENGFPKPLEPIRQKKVKI